MKSTFKFRLSPTQVLIASSSVSSTLTSIQNELRGIQFSTTASKTSINRQLNSSLDEAIMRQMKALGEIETDSIVEDTGGKIGKLDFVLTPKDSESSKYYVEIEKTDKKRLWFDFIKILTCLKIDKNGKGLIICPINYAHSNGVWNLFKEAKSYKAHLERVFEKHNDILKRVSIIGYEQQYKDPDGEAFVPYTMEHYRKIKDSLKK